VLLPRAAIRGRISWKSFWAEVSFWEISDSQTCRKLVVKARLQITPDKRVLVGKSPGGC